jgi:hypothetical protein
MRVVVLAHKHLPDKIRCSRKRPSKLCGQ